MSFRCRIGRLVVLAAVLLVRPAYAQPPTLESVFPAGGQVGQAVEVTVAGSLQGVQALRCSVPGVTCDRLDASRFRLSIPADAPLGQCDMWAVGETGVSGPRPFILGNRGELTEIEAADLPSGDMDIPQPIVVNGRIHESGDVDVFRFEARQGQRIVIECWAERLDSRLRAVLEVFDARGQRLAVNRGYFGIDPLIVFSAPLDGTYSIRIQDLTSSGGAEHDYRLDVSSEPRVAFCVPAAVERGRATRITLYGWNLVPPNSGSASAGEFDQVDVEIPASLVEPAWPLPVRLHPTQVELASSSFPWISPGGHVPLLVGVTDVPVTTAEPGNHSPSSAQTLVPPCEVSGLLVEGNECDWFVFAARRGEVFFLEAHGQRIQSPVDLEIGVYSLGESTDTADPQGSERPGSDLGPLLARFTDEVRNIGGSFPTAHPDPAGRWLVPADGRYAIAIRNVIGGLQADPRRVYRLSVRREEPDFHLVALPNPREPGALNVQRGGRQVVDLLAFRRRGFSGSIRVAARDLPAGIECPDVWFGPDVDRAALIVSAGPSAASMFGDLVLEGFAEDRQRTLGVEPSRFAGAPSAFADPSRFARDPSSSAEAAGRPRAVRAGTVVRSGVATGWGRIVSGMPLSIAGDSPLRITADGHETLDHHLYGQLQVRHAPGGILDVAVRIERRDTDHQAPVKLIGFGVPETIQNQTTLVPAGQTKGYLSFILPPTMAVGRYSIVIAAETTVPGADNKPHAVTVYSNPVTFDVEPAAFLVEVAPFSVTRARRGETIQIGYSAKRLNGFIGKMHTELASPDRITDVVGLQARGETFVGQSDAGSLQILVNDQAPLGRQPLLRLFTVGVVEDEPIYHGSCILNLEIVE